MKGLPCSGKTKWTRDFCGRKRDTVRVSWTEMRRIMSQKEFDRSITLTAVHTALIQVRRLLGEGKTVVLDECNLYGPSFAPFVGEAQRCKAAVKWQTMKTPVSECKSRCLQGGGSSADVMRIDVLSEKYKSWLSR